MFFKPKAHESELHNVYERRGEKATHKIAEAIARKSWKWTILNLAWTVGPVTFLALQFGHYIGFGSEAPLRSFVYFAAYTFLAGILAVIASILHEALFQPKIESEQRQLLEVIARLHHLMLHTRDTILRVLEPQERKMMGAYQLLQSAGISPSALGTAVLDLTDSEVLADTARQALVFAEQGMQSRVDEVWQQCQPELEKVRAILEPTAPVMFELLTLRLRGDSPALKNGLERGNGFIERALQAADENAPHHMTLEDAADIFTLAFELLNGRRIAMLNARLKGDEAFEMAQQELDEARHQYRMAFRARNTQMTLMLEQLYNTTDTERVFTSGEEPRQMMETILEALQAMPPRERTGFKAMYERLMRANRSLAQHHRKLQEAERRYSKVWHKNGGKLTFALQMDDVKGSGFYIEERSIRLKDKEKILLMHALYNDLPMEKEKVSEKRIKRLAMTIASQLDDLIDMSQPEELLAIESSNAANFGFITQELTPVTKAGWASIVIDAVHENRRKASHRLAKNLISFYRVPLTDAMIELFVEKFGAKEDVLREYNEQEGHLSAAPSPALPSKPIAMKSWSQLFTLDRRY